MRLTCKENLFPSSVWTSSIQNNQLVAYPRIEKSLNGSSRRPVTADAAAFFVSLGDSEMASFDSRAMVMVPAGVGARSSSESGFYTPTTPVRS